MALLAYVGCRTTRERKARGRGLAVFRVPDQGPWERLQLVEGLENPSFLAAAPDGRTLFCVHGDREAASAFRIGADGQLAHLNTVATGGRNPVHLAVLPGGRHLAVANHATSSVAVLGIEPEGGLGGIAELVELAGTPGPHRVEQPHAKPHQVRPDPSGRWLLVPDKGLDRVFAFAPDPATGRLAEGPALGVRSGSGPRHMAWGADGRHAYVLNELGSTVLACRWDAAGGTLHPFQLLPTLPEDFAGESRAAEVVVSPDGGSLYASNRGHDSIAVFAVDRATGRLAPRQWVGSGGRTPRHVALDPAGRRLYAANEDSDGIAAFHVRPDGGLEPAGEAARTGSPVCLLLRDA